MKHYRRGCHPNTRKNGFKKGHTINVGRKRSKKTCLLISRIKKGIAPRGSGWHHTEATKLKIKLAQIGSKGNNWKEEGLSYSGVHNWLHKNYVKEFCEHCSAKKTLDWALIKGENYSKLREKYIVLCRSCHVKYDKKNHEHN